MKRINYIAMLISILTLAVMASAMTATKVSAQGLHTAGPYIAIDPSLTTEGPEIAVGQTFTVNITMNNVTTSNVPQGLAGVEVHATWDNSTLEATHFVDMLGQTNGALLGPVVEGLGGGFYVNDTTLSAIHGAGPYPTAVFYKVAAATTPSGGPWWGNGTIATLTFQVIAQPSPPISSSELTLYFVSIYDQGVNVIPCQLFNGTYEGLALSTFSENATAFGVNYTVSIASDANITAPAGLGWENTSSVYGPATFTFNATNYGVAGSVIECNVTVPKTLMSGPWTVTVDDSPPLSTVATTDSSNSYVWFNFTDGTHIVKLHSTYSVPEFPTTSLMLLLVTATLVITAAATGLRKRRFLH